MRKFFGDHKIDENTIYYTSREYFISMVVSNPPKLVAVPPLHEDLRLSITGYNALEFDQQRLVCGFYEYLDKKESLESDVAFQDDKKYAMEQRKRK